MTENPSCRYCMLVGLAAGIAAFCVLVACLIVTMPGRARAEAPANCQPVDPASIVYTHMGWSIAQGDGHVYIPPGNVVYHDGPLMVCMPQTGMLKLYVPSSGWLVNAHGEYAWIEKEFAECCTKRDCFPIKVTPETQGAIFGYRTEDGDFVPHSETKPSRDPEGRHWRCYSLFPVKTPRKGCLFINPGSG